MYYHLKLLSDTLKEEPLHYGNYVVCRIEGNRFINNLNEVKASICLSGQSRCKFACRVKVRGKYETLRITNTMRVNSILYLISPIDAIIRLFMHT